MIPARLVHGIAACTGAACLMGTVGCAGLIPKPPVAPATYTLDDAPPSVAPTLPRAPTLTRVLPTLAVRPPQAAPGFDSARIVYIREAPRLDTYAHSEWVDTPPRMLAPLIVAALADAGALQAAVRAPSDAAADISLDTEIVRLQHDFSASPSHVRFTLRATLVDSVTRRVLATREFDERVDSASEDARGGVVAAHTAVQAVLKRLALFCVEAAENWRTAEAGRSERRN